MTRRERNQVNAQLSAIPTSEDRVLLATGRYIGEGFDDARLDTLFITLPISWRGTVAQYVGRLHRLHEGKRDVRVYDYADLNVRMLERMFDRRCRAYEDVGYTIVVPASAIPGWPSDVRLPIDPLWKRDYGTSVKRLVRDGVDVPLASLFVVSARPMPIEAAGVDRARSASEAFFFKRLETLDATRGLFELNAHLPLPFDGWGKMEVDLLSDVVAYRRDRHKDRLLQVLRAVEFDREPQFATEGARLPRASLPGRGPGQGPGRCAGRTAADRLDAAARPLTIAKPENWWRKKAKATLSAPTAVSSTR